MEKQTKHKIMRFIPKALSFQNPPFSPSRDKEVTATRHGGRGFSGPKEAWRRRRNNSVMVDTPQEPTSPKVSCLGKIKQRQTQKKKMATMIKKEKDGKRSRVPSKERISIGGAKSEEKAPALGQMKRFASSRSSLSNFDWAAQLVPEDSDRGRSYLSVEERDREEVRIPFSAPLAFVVEEMRLQPKKEISLWKRRTMAPPRPLTLDS